MFAGATSFNRNLTHWDLSSATSLYYTFNFAKVFNGDVSGWDVARVGNMQGLFR